MRFSAVYEITFTCRAAALTLLIVLLAPAARAASTLVSVPLSLDYPLLRHMLVAQLFDTPERSREILQDPAGCSRIVLSEPALAPRGGDLEVVARVQARLDVASAGSCKQVLAWRGTVGFLGRPVVQAGGRSVKLAPVDTWLRDSAGKLLSSGPLWRAADTSLQQFFAGFVLDFSPYIGSLGDFLPSVLPRRNSAQLQSLVDSLTLGEVVVSPASLDVSIRARIDDLQPLPKPAAALSAEELQQLETRWQMMDALFVAAIKHYASVTELRPLRGTLLDILIDSRYSLQDALSQPASRSGDAVRRWFIESWQRLGPVARSVAREQSGQEQLLWFTALTATDALHALDQLGPTIGLDISTNGLRNLARMINAGQAEEILRYSENVDPQLQQLLREQMPPPQPERDGDAPPRESSAFEFNFSLFSRAHASTSSDRLDSWVPASNELATYLPLVAELLQRTTGQVLRDYHLASQYHDLYGKLVLATAWQESCWRQYVVKSKRLEPLRSATGDTGMMQINERVWRGFYDLHRLRWDISYNSRAGAEILLNYLVKYALRKGEQQRSGGLANLARASYSAYNGGPGQVARYRRADVRPEYRKIDKLFWEKFRQVDAGKQMNVARCLGVEGPLPVLTAKHSAAGTAKDSSTSQSKPP